MCLIFSLTSPTNHLSPPCQVSTVVVPQVSTVYIPQVSTVAVPQVQTVTVPQVRGTDGTDAGYISEEPIF